jgi:DNA-binding transcriptional LysR family regulator
VKRAAAELSVSDAAVSLHVGQLRKELSDQLFTRTASGLAFTPGGLRLASRAAEMLNLQERTIIEVSQAAGGQRLLRVAASSLFAEYAAPGLIELFASRAADLEVELSVHDPRKFNALLHALAVDVAFGPQPANLDHSLTIRPVLNYTMIVVASPGHPLARPNISIRQLRDQTWLLGPSAVTDIGVAAAALRRINVPEKRQRIFQSHAAALEEAMRGHGVAWAVSFAVAQDLAKGRLVRIGGPGLQFGGVWNTLTLDGNASPTAGELVRFITTPRATRAMTQGLGVRVGRFRPAIHITLWNY